MFNANRRLKVFIYHLDNDQDIIRTLCDQLDLNNVEVVLPEDVEYRTVSEEADDEQPQQARGQKEAFRRTVQNVDVVLFCLSEVFDEVVSLPHAEWQIALDAALEKRQGDIFILPVCLNECLVPERMKKWQPIKLHEKGGYQSLMYALKGRGDKVKVELTPRTEWKENPFVTDTQAEENERTAPRSSFLVWAVFLAIIFFSIFVLFQINSGSDTFATQTAGSVQSLAERATQVVVARATDRAATVTADASVFTERRIQTEVFLTGVASTATVAAEQAVITPTVTLTVVSLPTQIVDGSSLMVLVPDGNFIMGQGGFTDADPVHMLRLPAYYIDQYEVTNARYKECVNAGECQPPAAKDSQTRPNYYDAPEFVDFPVINVDWNMAQAYCAWRGARLPTEAEWEKAARGANGLVQPWGDETGCFFANHNACVGDTSDVDKYVIGRSTYGALNMAGNVAEWTSSLFTSYPYDAKDGREDPASTGPRSLRGGSWASAPAEILTYIRFSLDPTSYRNDLGFRCVRDATR